MILRLDAPPSGSHRRKLVAEQRFNEVAWGGNATACVRLFLQQQGDTLTAQEPYKRWWSVTYVELHEGEFTLAASLSPDEWTSVFGQRGAEVLDEFNAAIS